MFKSFFFFLFVFIFIFNIFYKSKMKWVEQGEKPNKYFHNLEKTTM